MNTPPTPLPRRIYCDNSATSFPKPPEVLQAMIDFATHVGGSAGRGQYAEARASAALIRSCRQRFNTLFHGEDPNHFIFTLNCTDALNLAIKGILKPGDHAITSSMDHNSVLRPFNALAHPPHPLPGIDTTHIPVGVDTLLNPDDLKKALRPNTKLIAITHASNVTGALQPIRAIGKIAREAGIPYLVDAAQSAGHVSIDLQADHIDLLAFPGHKGLLGPLGTGALYIRPGLEKNLTPLRHGGTGSQSDHDIQPDTLPDKYESGSHNAIGIAGLNAALGWILNRTVPSLFEHDQSLCCTFMEALENVEGLRYFGPQGIKNRIGVFSIQIDNLSPATIANRLESEFGILARPGLHCAPKAHAHLNTANTGGTTRLSFGPFITNQDVQYAADALAHIALENLSLA